MDGKSISEICGEIDLDIKESFIDVLAANDVERLMEGPSSVENWLKYVLDDAEFPMSFVLNTSTAQNSEEDGHWQAVYFNVQGRCFF